MKIYNLCVFAREDDIMSNTKKILIVDDNKEFCENISDVLGLNGYEVDMAYDGFQALKKARKESFDLVMMDVKMPVMDGVETFKQFREIAPNTPVIMVTAFAVEDLLKDALNSGAFGFLRKPVDFDRLFDLIEAALPDGALIMVVDDDENLCYNIQDIMVEKNYRVSIAKDGEIAIRKAEEKDFDIIILDLKLPTLNGLETYLAIREFRPDVTVIPITGYAKEMSAMAREIVEKNAYACLEKPLDLEQFVRLLGKILEKKTNILH